MTDLRAQLQEGLGTGYTLERELGRGGMATVFLARDLKHDRPVAFKVLHPELAMSLGPERFLREIKLAARLQHPHILTVLDSGETAGRLWFTMPLVEGESLRDRLRRERQLPVEDALRIAREAAQALQYAHSHGVIHRDIKPENLLLTDDGNTLVADFGIARSFGSGTDEKLTETGLVVGTPAYMSPEQSAGDKGLDARTDVYSLAAVLYEMLSGEPPFTGATTQAMLVRRLTEPAPSARSVRVNLPESADQAIRKALSPVVADRFGTMAQFGQALDAAGRRDGGTVGREAGAAATAVVPSAPPAVPPSRRPAVPIAALALVLGILIGLGVLFAWSRNQGDGPAGGSRVIAVLPFENLGDSADAYFADGVADEVRTKLAQVAGLEVIARGSVVEYRGTAKRPTDVARELGANYLLTGTVRWEKAAGAASRVRVTPELVEVRSGQTARTRWGQQFDASLTNVFQVQAEIATRVADALNVALADSVRAELAERPTASLEAYDAFLKGEAATSGMSRTDLNSLHRGLPHYQRAVELDPEFVPAWARLAILYSRLYSTVAPTPELAEKARGAAERARQLGPDRPEAINAQGTYQRLVLTDPAQALETFEAGLRLAPSNVDLIGGIASIEFSRGNWEQALSRLQRAAALDPRSASAARRLAYALISLRRYPEAEASQARALALAPSDLATIHQGAVLALAQGDRARAKRIARNPPPGVKPIEQAYYFARYEELGWLLDPDQQREVLTLGPDAFGDDRAPWATVLSLLHAMRGQPALTRAYADSARMAYEQHIAAEPNDPQQQVFLGMALAWLGRKDGAIRAATRATEIAPIATDGYIGPYIQMLLARVHMMVGNYDQAVELLKEPVTVPNNLTKAWLRVDPTWDPLRNHPGFQRLVAGSSSP
jgi:eukaryotic-like serine/threonine-protein kinase